MDQSTLETILTLITAGAAITLFLSHRALRRAESELGSGVEPIEECVAGDPTTLSTRAAAALARRSERWPGAMRIIERTDAQVTFEAHSNQVGRRVGAGSLHFCSATPERTDVRAVFVADSSGMLTAARVLIYVGMLLVPAMWFAFHTWTVPHHNPAIAGQTLQMAQCVHVLWPPFLVIHLARQRVRIVRTQLHALISNLPYEPAA